MPSFVRIFLETEREIQRWREREKERSFESSSFNQQKRYTETVEADDITMTRPVKQRNDVTILKWYLRRYDLSLIRRTRAKR